MRSLWDIIDEIREKPEHIRRRYMFGYVSMTMVLIGGIWVISVQESFRSVVTTSSVEDMKERTSQILPGSLGTQSLSELLEKGEVLDAGSDPASVEDFFESEMRAKNQEGSSEMKTMDEGQ